jgi:uncharacterized phage protein (TIGR01671 family)
MEGEIKFRGIATCDVEETDVKKGDWVFGQVLFNESDRPFIAGKIVDYGTEYLDLLSWVTVQPESLGQFTGLHDRDGKEIYEGDIVEYTSTYDNFRADEGVPRGVVKWQHFRSCWSIARNYSNHDLWRNVQNGGKCTVVGNIHQNPDLTEQ